MSTLGERIKYSREAKGLLQNDLAKLIGVKSSGVISNWENDLNKPDAEKIVRLCNVLDVSASYLLDYYGKSSFEFNLLEEEHIKKYRSLDDLGKETVEYILNKETARVKELQKKNARISELESGSNTMAGFVENSDIPARLINYYYRLASAGTGQIVFDMPPTKRIEIPNIPKYEKVDYAIGVNGNSMEPTFHDGDMLLIEMTEEISYGDIGIFLVEGESYVKKLGGGELISLNPKYENIPLTGGAKCMGRVVDKFIDKTQ